MDFENNMLNRYSFVDQAEGVIRVGIWWVQNDTYFIVGTGYKPIYRIIQKARTAL